MSKTINDINAIKLQINLIEDKVDSLRKDFDTYLETVSKKHTKRSIDDDYDLEDTLERIVNILERLDDDRVSLDKKVDSLRYKLDTLKDTLDLIVDNLEI